MPAKPKRTWTEKLHDSKDLPKLFEVDEEAAKKLGGRRGIIPAPLDVDAAMRKGPKASKTRYGRASTPSSTASLWMTRPSS